MFFYWASPQKNFPACVAGGIVFCACESFGGKAGANACTKEASADGARKFKASPPHSSHGFVAPTNDPTGYAGKENSSEFELISHLKLLSNCQQHFVLTQYSLSLL